MMMKKPVTLLLTGCLLLCLTACGKESDITVDSTIPNPTNTTQPTETPGTPEPTEAPEPTQAPTQAPAQKTVAPLPVTIDLNNLTDCTLAISIATEDLLLDNVSARVLKFTAYTYDLYDMVDISMLTVGDTILLRNEEVVINSLNTTPYGALQINGGLDAGGYELVTDNHTVYYETGYSDVKTYFELGESVLSVSKDFIFVDNADPEGNSATFTLEDLFTDKVSHVYGFTPHNTRIIIENGVITRMERSYTP